MSKIKVGDIFETSEGCKVEVVRYGGWDEVSVRFLDEYGYEKVVRVDKLRNGEIKNPYHLSVYGRGCLGVGPYSASEKVNGKSVGARCYKLWNRMLERCYSDGFLSKRPSYKNVKVDESWWNYQTFADWCHKQPNHNHPDFHLDKDLIDPEAKLYSASTCSFVPSQINSLLSDSKSRRGDLPRGVTAIGSKFRAQMNVNGEVVYLGNYQSPEQAFEVYKEAKEAEVKRVANKYKDQIDPRAYDYLMKWEVPVEE